jgi:hypothetical protein
MKSLAAIMGGAAITLFSAAFGMSAATTAPSPVSILRYSWFFRPGMIPELPPILASPNPPGGSNWTRYPQTMTVAMPVLPPKEPDQFRYRLKLRNDSGKQIRKIIWDYVFLNPESNAVESIIRFDHKVMIDPGKTKQLEGQTNVPPTYSLNVHAKDAPPGKFERVQILQIYFSDGTTWDGYQPVWASQR